MRRASSTTRHTNLLQLELHVRDLLLERHMPRLHGRLVLGGGGQLRAELSDALVEHRPARES